MIYRSGNKVYFYERYVRFTIIAKKVEQFYYKSIREMTLAEKSVSNK